MPEESVDSVTESNDAPTSKQPVEGTTSGKTVDERLRDLGVMGDLEQESVEVEYLGRGKFENFSRHGQKRQVSVPESERLLELSGDDGPLFKKV